MTHSVTAAAAHTNYFYDRVLLDIIDKFKHSPSPSCCFSLVPGCLFEFVFSRYLRLLLARHRQK
ncbi:MAG TPA: hypothetical protein ENI00_00850 [Marinobacter antarcticus]|uniref:Uncharacterized protein n=1 Tax=Marinobacter antarcticus TaxID=564117 RepID=A0A831R0J6_9GAMM|nr:hypothetical protein [Marinobacter antarcticus]